MDQSLSYVQNQLAQGKTREQITAALLGGGWQQGQVDALFAKLEPAKPISTPVTPTPQTSPVKPVETIGAPSVPASTPVPITATTTPPIAKPEILPLAGATPPASMPATDAPTMPVKQAETLTDTGAPPAKKSSIWRVVAWTGLTIILAVGALLGAAYYLGKTNKTASNSAATVATTATYSANGLTFSYPIGWQKTTINDLVGTAATDSSTTDLFMTAANYAKAKQQAASVGTTGGTSILEYVASLSNLVTVNVLYVSNSSSCPTVVTTLPGVTDTSPTCVPLTSDATAKSRANETLKTTYAADGTSSYNSSAVVDQTKIQTTTIAGKTAYWVTNGPANKPFVVVVVPVATGACAITFAGAASPTALPTDELALYNSIGLQ